MHSALSLNISGANAEPANNGVIDHVVRLVLVDELGLVRESIAHFVASQPGFEVNGQCSTSAEALEVLKSSPPDIVLLDFEVGTEHGTDFILAARQANYQGHFLIVAGAPDVRKSALALKAGASGIFLKSEPPDRLLKAIRIVAEGGVWVDPRVIQRLAELFIKWYPRIVSDGDEKSNNPQDESERNVLLGILGGLSNRKIGDDLGTSESMVKSIIQRLFTRYGVRTRSQLVRIALESSLASTREFMRYEPDRSSGAGPSISAKPPATTDPLSANGQSYD